MLFGLTKALAVFQALVNDFLCDMLNKFLFFYVDDIMIFSETEEEHIQHVPLVLRHLIENFQVSTVAFLGFIVRQGQLLPSGQLQPPEICFGSYLVYQFLLVNR